MVVQDTNKSKLFLAGLAGISLIILIHELGHFLAAHYFGVPTPIFSIGFGPALIQIPLQNTIFQIAVLPFGGYVDIDQTILATKPYIQKMIIIFAGIIFNFIFTYIVLLYFSRKNADQKTLGYCLNYLRQEHNNESAIIGPIGLISIIGKSFTTNIHLFWLILALISLNVGLFNLLPLPFFDGGKAFLFTLEAIVGTPISENNLSIISFIFFIIFVLLIMLISINDISKLKQK